MIVTKQVESTVKALDTEERSITFVMSSEAVDRDGDIIRVDGWELDRFQRNPVFLVFHDQRQFPIGKVESVWGEGTQLLGRVRFAEKGTYEVADVAYELYRQGILNAVSVGFRGLEFEPMDGGGLEFRRQELLELSAVPVPANPEAVARKAAKTREPDATADGGATVERLTALINRIKEINHGTGNREAG